MTRCLSRTMFAATALGDQPAVMEHQHALRERHHDLHEMLDDQDGDAAFGDPANQTQRALDLAGIEPGIDFVQHQHLGPHRHALGQLETLAAAERQRRSRPVGERAQAR